MGVDQIGALQRIIELEFVRRYEIADAVEEAKKRLSGAFGGTDIHTQVVVDPEDGHEQLVLVVPTALPIDDALARLEKFDRDWFLEAASQTHGRLNVWLAFLT